MHEHLQRLFDHMFWADRRIVERLAEAAGAGPDEAMRLFSHVLAAERVWLHRLRGEDTARQPIWPEWSLEELRSAVTENADGYARYLEETSGEDLAANVHYRNSQGVEFRTPAVDILTHVALHGSYHRGQVAPALRRAGAEPVNTDFITYVRELP